MTIEQQRSKRRWPWVLAVLVLGLVGYLVLGGEDQDTTSQSGDRGRTVQGEERGGLLDFLFAPAQPIDDLDHEDASSAREGAVVSGRVLRAEDGMPVQGAMVLGATSHSREFWSPDAAEVAEFSAETDEHGRYRLEALSQGKLMLQVQFGGLAVTNRELMLGNLEIRQGEDFLMLDAGSVAGRIFEQGSGAPVPGFRVLAATRGEGTGGRSALSDEQGRYRIDGLVPGLTAVSAGWGSHEFSVPGGVAEAIREVNVRPGEVVELVDFEVRRGVALQGHVTDAGGNPLSEVEVYVKPDLHADFNGDGDTDVHGDFRIGGLPEGAAAIVRVKLEGYRPDERKLTLPVGVGSAVQADFVLERTCNADGIVLDRSGEPMAWAEVWASPTNERETPAEFKEFKWYEVGPSHATTGSDGRFTLDDLHSVGQYRLKGRLGGWAGHVDGPEFTCGPGVRITDLELTLVPPSGGVVAGQVVDEKNEPVEGARVSVQGVYGSDDWERTGTVPGKLAARSDEHGRFRLEGLASEAIALVADHRFFSRAKLEDVTVGTMDVRMTLRSLGRVRGRVSMKDNAVILPAYFRVRVCTDSGQRAEQRCVDADRRVGLPTKKEALFGAVDEGAFEVRDVPPGRAVVVALAEGYQPAVVTTMVPVGGAAEDLSLVLGEGALLDGVVVDAAGAGVAGAQVRAVLVTERNRRRLSRITRAPYGKGRMAHTDEGGGFRISGLQAGTYQLFAEHASYAPADKVVAELDDGAELTGLRLALVSGGRVEVRVTQDGGPLPGLEVQLQRPGGMDLGSTDENGSFIFDRVPAGQFTIRVMRDQGPPVRLSVMVEEGETVRREIDLKRLGSVSGRIVGLGRRAAFVMLEPADRDREQPQRKRTSFFAMSRRSHGGATKMVRGRGTFTMKDVPAGRYLLEVVEFAANRAQRGEEVEQAFEAMVSTEVEVLPGEEVSVELTVDPEDSEETE